MKQLTLNLENKTLPKFVPAQSL